VHDGDQAAERDGGGSNLGLALDGHGVVAPER
jgi:hypothetical protein